MLLGALMVLAPGAGAELPDGTVEIVGGGNVPICHATSAETNPYILNSPSYSATGTVSGVNHEGHDGPVFVPGMKKDKIQWGDIIPPISLDGQTLYYPGKNWTDAARELYAVCIGELEPEGATLVIEKEVPGEGDTTPFGFSVKQDQQQVGSDDLADGEFFETSVLAGAVEITETVTGGYTLTDVVCTRDNGAGAVLVDDEAVAVTRNENVVSLTAADGDIISCTFTNTPDTHGITVVKKNDANGNSDFNESEVAPSTGSPVKFQVELINTGNQELDVATLTDTWSGLAEPINLLTAPDLLCTRGEATVDLTTALPVGTTTTCTFTLASYAPAAGTSRVNKVAVTTDEGASDDAESTVSTPGEIIIIETPTTTIPEPEPASLTLNKLVEAADGGEGPATWQVQFDVLGAESDESRVLDQDGSTASFAGLDAGSYTITELRGVEDTSSLTDVDCVQRNGGDAAVTEDLGSDRATLVLDEGDDVVCTFTNTYPAVLPSDNEPEPEPTVEEPTEEVKGDVVTRPQTLPRTGNESKGLAGAGALLVALGAAMVLGSKRQLAQR
jgi:LPXTG-motif cell wall-anchored protein